MTTRADIVAEARTWLGTPFAHQGRIKGVGTDCGGFVASVGIEVGAFRPDAWSTVFVEHAGYGRTPINGTFEAICRKYMTPIAVDAVQPGDVVLMRFKSEPQHVAILADYLYGGLSMIHAYRTAVVEHRFADVWRARVTEAFALPGVA